LAVHDISVGGVCVIGNAELARARVLDRYDGCTVALGEQLGEIRESLQVRHVTPVSLRNGKTQTRVGLRFENMSASDQARVQRFLVKVEQAKRALVDD
jgi:c-di-GMP-binding flagellar brake protein YcgR